MLSWLKSRKQSGGLPRLPPIVLPTVDLPLKDELEPAEAISVQTEVSASVIDEATEAEIAAPSEASTSIAPMKVLIGRHNGIGDIVMAAPFIGAYLEMGYDVTISCDVNKHAWISWMFPGLKTIDCFCNPYTDYNQTVEGYDFYLNLNKIEMVDDMGREMGVPAANMQFNYSMVAVLKGLPRPPKGLSPSRYVNYRADRGDDILVFTRSTHPSRTMAADLIAAIRARMPNVIVDPVYPDLIEMCKAIASAQAVIGMDSGAIHLAEAFATPWRVLHTTMNFDVRHRFYEHGSAATSLQAQISCSPCFFHSGCDELRCTASFPIEAIFAGLHTAGLSASSTLAQQAGENG